MVPAKMLATSPSGTFYLPIREGGKLAMLQIGEHLYKAINDFTRYDFYGLHYRR